MANEMNESISIDYDSSCNNAVLIASNETAERTWFQQILRLLTDNSEKTEYNYKGKIITPWWIFIKTKYDIGSILKVYKVTISFTDSAKNLVLKSKNKETEIDRPVRQYCSSEDIKAGLMKSDWHIEGRSLKKSQERNLLKIAQFSSAATFSVPGAGKTTEALAYFALKADEKSKLIVVAPKNAFLSWDEQISICFYGSEKKFVRLRGGAVNISQLLNSNADMFLITYQQFPLVENVIGQYLSNNDCFLFLDESHRIKSGAGKVIADSILNISHLPKYKLILSGTPMPQSYEDLIPQFQFLYPEVKTDVSTVVNDFQPIFVRTTKSELDLPDLKRKIVNVPMNPAQQRLYNLLRDEFIRQADTSLSAKHRRSYRALGKSVIRIIEVVSNPALLLNDLQFMNNEFLSEVVSEGSAPKLLYACERARQLALKNQKCIIWTTFRANVETLAERLSDLNAVFIHGGVDAGGDDDDYTREGKINKFKNDDSCYVLVANPAAASESISLHMVCHHAIYVDRTYNAAHYLQSEDRIHRLGLDKDTMTFVEILCCPDSIDENINDRLILKVQRMAEALNDDSLTIETIPYDIGDEPEKDIETVEKDDIDCLLKWLKKRT